MKKVFVILSSCLLLGCVNKSTHQKALQTIDSLRVANQTLIEENDELLNGEKRLIDYIELYHRNKDYVKSYEFITLLKSRHPASNYLIQKEKMVVSIERGARIMHDSIDKAREDSVKLANINELGIWEVRDVKNDFDEPTGKKYLSAYISGRFSNSATAGSPLRVWISIDSVDDISVYFDEYSDWTYDNEDISHIKVVNKEARKVYESLWLDQASFDKLYEKGGNKTKSYKKLVDILADEGIYEIEVYTEYKTMYIFTINSQYLENAMLKAGMKKL